MSYWYRSYGIDPTGWTNSQTGAQVQLTVTYLQLDDNTVRMCKLDVEYLGIYMNSARVLNQASVSQGIDLCRQSPHHMHVQFTLLQMSCIGYSPVILPHF